MTLNGLNLIKLFKHKILAGEENLQRPIKAYGINRAGLELAGLIDYEKINNYKKRRIILLSNKESIFVNKFKDNIREERYKLLINDKLPLIITTERYHDPILIDVCKELKCPLILAENIYINEILKIVLDYLDPLLSVEEEVHASLVNIFGLGVLIKGKSGIGKSEALLELLKRNHLIIGDDRINIYKKNGLIYGECHPTLQNLIEVRGLGIIDISKIYGKQYIIKNTKIDLVIEMIETKSDEQIERLGNQKTTIILDHKFRLIQIPIYRGRNSSCLIETAVAKYKTELSTKSGFTILNERLEQK